MFGPFYYGQGYFGDATSQAAPGPFAAFSPPTAPTVALDFTGTVMPLGKPSRDFTPIQNTLQFTTVSPGGFGQATFNVVGDHRRTFTYLAVVRIYIGTSIVWEGRIEDQELAPADDPIQTTVTCFGYQRRFTDVSTRRIWAKRDLDWNESLGGSGSALGTGSGVTVVKEGQTQIATGQYNPADLTKTGVQFAGNGNFSFGSTAGDGTDLIYDGLTLTRIHYDATLAGSNVGSGANKMQAYVLSSPDGVTWTKTASSPITASGTYNDALVAGATQVRLVWVSNGTVTPASGDTIAFSNIRVLGTALDEDTAGGFYGDSILRDILSLVPDIGTGVIEVGNDFTIPAIDRAVRDTCQSVIDEVTGYYNRVWAVWEGPTFSWTTAPFDQVAAEQDKPQWIILLDQLQPGSRIQGSIDTLARTVYVTYTNALDGRDAEQSATAIDERNPLVRPQITKDVIIAAPTVMTDNSALLLAQLEASRLLDPPVNGTLVLAAGALIKAVGNSDSPAAMIRAGGNVYLPEFGADGILLAPPRKDSRSLFHIASTELDMEAGTMTLQLDTQAREIDVITARLASATKVLTG